MRLRLLSLLCLGTLATTACEQERRVITADAGDLSARCVSKTDLTAIAEGRGFACGRGRWCDRVDGICKTGACGYDDDCEDGFTCNLDTHSCKPPCDLGGGVGCECTDDDGCPALAFCWGGHCLNAGVRDCSRDEQGNLNHSDCTKDPSRAGDAVQVVQCNPLDLGVDCLTDSDCAGSACNQETRRCEQLSCMRPSCARDGDCPAGQRCHPSANSCVEDLGCRFAHYFPALACASGQECDEDANVCRNIEVGECTEVNQTTVCRDQEVCHVPVGQTDGRCVQCITDFECTVTAADAPCAQQSDCAQGTLCVADRNDVSTCRYSTGTHCNRTLGQCIGSSGCSRDVDCMAALPEAVSCTTDIQCPPETYCENTGTTDEPNRTCLAPTGRRCATGTNECVLPLCNLDEDCQVEHGGDVRWRCDTAMWRCGLPEPRCDGDELEPNNAAATATPLEPFREAEDSPSYATGNQLLCRGDIDMYRIGIEDGQSIDATLTLDEGAFARVLDEELNCTRESHCQQLREDAFCMNNLCHAAEPPSAPFHLELLAPEGGEVIGQARLRDGNWSGTASASALNAGTYYLRLRSAATDADLFPYSLRVNLSTPPPCEIDEPNNARNEATGLSIGIHTLDTYSFRVPRDHTVEVSMISEAELAVRLLGTNAQEILAESETQGPIENLEWINDGDGARNVFLTVTASVALPEEVNGYVLRIGVKPPFRCGGDADIAGDRDGAQALQPNQDGLALVNDGAICSADDVDVYRIDLDPGQRLGVRLNNSPRYPLDLRLLDRDGIAHFGAGPVGFRDADTTNTTGARRAFFASIGWNEAATPEQRGTDVPFSLRVTIEQGDICPDPEAEGEPNATRDQATYLTSSAQPLERHLCGGTDIDWYAVNLVEDTPVAIEATFSHEFGDVDLYLFDANRHAIAVAASMDDNERIELARTDGGNHYLLVERFAGGAAVQTYSLRAQYTEGCQDDQLEANGGDSAAEAVTIRQGGGAFNWQRDLVLCGDEDWYRVLILANEQITISANGPADLTMTLMPLADGVAGDPVAQSVAGGNNGGRTIHELNYRGIEAFAFFALRVAGGNSRGEYSLTVTATP
jgi:hypothetical protein